MKTIGNLEITDRFIDWYKSLDVEESLEDFIIHISNNMGQSFSCYQMTHKKDAYFGILDLFSIQGKKISVFLYVHPNIDRTGLRLVFASNEYLFYTQDKPPTAGKVYFYDNILCKHFDINDLKKINLKNLENIINEKYPSKKINDYLMKFIEPKPISDASSKKAREMFGGLMD